MKQVFTIRSGSTADASRQSLSIRVGERHFGFAITNASATELYQLNWFTDEEITEQALEDIYLREPLLQVPYQQVKIGYDYPQSILVPVSQYNEQDNRPLLQAMYGINGKDYINTEAIGNWQLNNVYAVPQPVHNWVETHFIKAQQWHSYSIAIHNAELTDFEGSLAVDLRNDDFSLLASRGNKLLLAQSFVYANPADVLYYLLKVCQEFSLSQESVRLTLSGLVDKESALYREIHQYFIHLSFKEPSWSITKRGDSAYPAHFFSSLNDLARCES